MQKVSTWAAFWFQDENREHFIKKVMGELLDLRFPYNFYCKSIFQTFILQQAILKKLFLLR